MARMKAPWGRHPLTTKPQRALRAASGPAARPWEFCSSAAEVRRNWRDPRRTPAPGVWDRELDSTGAEMFESHEIRQIPFKKKCRPPWIKVVAMASKGIWKGIAAQVGVIPLTQTYITLHVRMVPYRVLGITTRSRIGGHLRKSVFGRISVGGTRCFVA